MGQPKKSKKKYSTPRHPWQKDRIDEEKELSRTYSLKNKKEIWKMKSILRNFKDQVKRLQALTGKQAELEKNQLSNKLLKLGLMGEGATFDDILELSVKAIMERRLQTLVVRKELARTMNQSRQFIVHGHIAINGEKINAPSYLVPVALESAITFTEKSDLADAMHPERVKEEKMPKRPEKKEEKKKTEEKKEEKPKKTPKKEEPKKKAKKEEKKEPSKEDIKAKASEPSKEGDKK